jgi:hypothetical protein
MQTIKGREETGASSPLIIPRERFPLALFYRKPPASPPPWDCHLPRDKLWSDLSLLTN